MLDPVGARGTCIGPREGLGGHVGPSGGLGDMHRTQRGLGGHALDTARARGHVGPSGG